MFYILTSTCSDYALASILGIVKRVIDIIRIVVPILLIIGGTITMAKGVFKPDDNSGNKIMKSFLNSIASAVIIMFLPFIINTFMAVISAYGEVGINESGNTLTFNISECWTNAEVSSLAMDSANDNTKSSISDEVNNAKTNSNNNNSNNSNSNNKNNSNNNQSSNNSTNTTHNSFVLVGDSRFVGQDASTTKKSNTTYIAKVSQGLSYLKDQASTMKKYDSNKTAYVINMGVNDLYNASSYVSYINSLAKDYKGDIYFLSVNPVEENKASQYGYSIKNSDIKSFNSTLQKGLKNVTYLDSYNYLINNGYTTTDGIHYTKETYQKIYSYITSNVK